MTSHRMEAVDPAVRITMLHGTEGDQAPRHGHNEDVPPLLYYTTCLARGSDPTAMARGRGSDYWLNIGARLTLAPVPPAEPEVEPESEPVLESVDEVVTEPELNDSPYVAPDEDGRSVPPVDEWKEVGHLEPGDPPPQLSFHRPSLGGLLLEPSLNLVSPPTQRMPDVARASPTAIIPPIPTSRLGDAPTQILPPIQSQYALRLFGPEDLAIIEPPELPFLGRRNAQPGG